MKLTVTVAERGYGDGVQSWEILSEIMIEKNHSFSIKHSEIMIHQGNRLSNIKHRDFTQEHGMTCCHRQGLCKPCKNRGIYCINHRFAGVEDLGISIGINMFDILYVYIYMYIYMYI